MPKPPIEPRNLSPREAACRAGVSRSRIYELLKSGDIVAKKDGSRTLVVTASIDAWLDRLKPWLDTTGPLLPVEQQQIAIERVSEPPPPIDQQQPAVALAPFAPDLAAEYEKRFNLIVGNLGPDEGRLRAFEFTVGVCRNHYRVELETAKRMTADAIKAARAV
jgi:excisionase family DNA binding protein